MEDDNGLELSLGLSFGASSAKSKGKIGSFSDSRTEEGDKGVKIVDDFKTFLQTGSQKQDPSVGSQRSDSVKPSEKFFNDLSKGANNNRSTELDEENRSEAGSKRKMLFDEMNNPKKLEREASHPADLHEKPKISHISITTEDGSTAENEDVAESEVEGSTSRLISHHDDGSKRFIGVSGSSEVPKEVKRGNLTYGNPFPVQTVNVLNVPYSLPLKDSNSVVTPGSLGHTPGMIQIMPTGNNKRSGTQPVNPGNLPVMFGYSPVQLPMLDKDNHWGMVSHPPQFHPSYAGRSPPNSDKHGDGLKLTQASMHTVVRNSSEAAHYEARTFEQVKGEGKQHATEEGSSIQAEEDVKGSSMNIRANTASDQSTPDGLSLDFSAIKPGIAADLKFGGSGSYPNLPWVSTTGTGPHGRTISGVTYRFSASQIKIVCACHGTHMSPEEFVRHASEECANPDNNNGLASFPSTNPAASAHS